jgi:hypothetical protein
MSLRLATALCSLEIAVAHGVRRHDVLVRFSVASLSSSNDLERVMDAARVPDWSFGLAQPGQIMATRDSGHIGLPWVVLAAGRGSAMKVSLYQPGDDLDVEGDVIGELKGNPRERGRQLRALLSDLELSQ